MSFKTPDQVWNVVDSIRVAGTFRSRNRARINALFNGDPPYTEKEARDNRIETNVNFLEATRILHQSTQQFTNAFMQPANYFTVALDRGPVFKRKGWSSTITKKLNKYLKRSPRYLNTLNNQFASAALHGPGPVTWLRRGDWCPTFRGVDEMMIPSNTLQSLENLDHWAVRISFTAAELMRVIAAKNPDPGWNIPLMRKIVPVLLKDGLTSNNSEAYYDWTNYERVQEDLKENSSYWGSDAVPALRCFDFYYQETDASSDKEPTWRRKIIIDRATAGYSEFQANAVSEWLYDGKDKDYGKSIEHILHCQFADGCVVPPYRWNSTRSLGFLLYGVGHLMNRMRCKWSDAVFESMLWYFRNVTDGDKERLEMVNLKHLGVIPQGLDFVPGSERHTIDPNLLNAFMGSNRQLMAESSASYVQDVEQRGNTPPSATQIIADVNASNALIGSMLTRAYTLQIPGYREVARRFCVSDHADCKKFREECTAEGVPQEVFSHFDAWEIQPDRVMGSGNKMMAIAQADRLWAIRPTLKPKAQEEVQRMYIEATTDDPAVAELLVPRESKENSLSVQYATLAWATLMMGQTVVTPDSLNRIEYATTLAQMLESEFEKIEASGTLPSLQVVSGLMNVMKTIEEIAVELSQDQELKPIVDEFEKILENSAELVKKYIGAIQESGQKQPGGPELSPEDQAKIQGMLIQAQAKARIAEENAAQKRQQKEVAFVQDQQRKDAALAGELAAGDLRTKADIVRGNMTAQNP